ncbi:MAG: SRPBCC family protein [Flavitalea sp.]
MEAIFHYFQINAPLEKVFEYISTPGGFDKWWSKISSGTPALGETFNFDFGPQYNWKAVVSKYIFNAEFELTMTKADQDWMNSTVGFRISEKNNLTEVQFYHTGWKEDNEHYRISNYCWAMYLRLLKRNLEYGEFVPYPDRLTV